MQFIEPNTYIADKGKTFLRIHNGFKKLDTPVGYFSNLTLGDILVDEEGKPLDAPIPDKIEYYEKVDAPKSPRKPSRTSSK